MRTAVRRLELHPRAGSGYLGIRECKEGKRETLYPI